jgi:hypothetical protein
MEILQTVADAGYKTAPHSEGGSEKSSSYWCDVPDIPKKFRMGFKGFSCSIRSLYAFNGTKVFRRILSASQMAKALGRDFVVLMYPFGERNRFIGLLSHSEGRSQTGIVYIQRKRFQRLLEPPLLFPETTDATDTNNVCIRSKLSPYWKFQRFILGLKDEYFFEHGHCVALWPMFDSAPYFPTAEGPLEPPISDSLRWALRDPWRADGKAVVVNENQLDLLIAGSWFVLYRSLPHISPNIKK